MITRQMVAEQIGAWLRHEITTADLVEWTESAIQDGDFGGEASHELAEIVARLGLADVRAFGLTWEECEQLLHQLGYKAHVEITAA
jgi:hypothetical protein